MSQPLPVYERILSKHGLATVFAIFLLWWVTTGISGDISAIKAKQDEHISETAHYLLGICRHTANNEVERAECNLPPRH